MDFPKVRVFTASALCMFSSIAVAQFPTTSGPQGVLVDPPLSSPSAIVLYDQTDNPTGTNVTSQDFETANDAFDAEAADDFVVPTGLIWRVTGAFVPGSYTSGPAAAVNLTFAVDAAGVPGGTVCSYPLQTPADAAGSFTFTLPTPCVLMPGKYWMIVQTRQDFGTAGQWFWNTRSVLSNAGAAWRNPGNGFATGCTSFSPLATCLPSSGGPDLNFSISGTPGGVSPPSPAECGSSTAYFETLAPVPIPDEGGPVATSTILVSGLSDPIWDLNVVTELVHASTGDLDITIQSPAGTIVTLSTDNGSTNDDVFDGTAWDDQANPGGQVPYGSNSGLVNDHTYTTGVTATLLAPEEALAAFIGQDPNGTWTITIDDDTATETGTLNGWGLQITTRQGGFTTSMQTVPWNSTPVPIPESGGPTAVSTIDASWHLGSFIRRIRPTINVTHTFPGDLDMTLMSPSGKIVTLTSDNGGTNDNIFAGTQFDDAANPGGQVPYGTNDGLAGDTAYVNLTPVPTLVSEEALALFVGEDPRGIWTLTIDDDANEDVGTLNSWSLEITTCTCAAAEQDNPVRVDEHASSGSSNLNGVFETGETVRFEPSWLNPGTTAFDLSFATTQNFAGPAGPTYSILDDSASYGGLAPGATANCFDASGNCYDLSIVSASRPTQHWDASIQETAFEITGPQRPGSPDVAALWNLHVGESFPDVPTGNLFYRFVETIFHKGVTGGCSATDYCPGNFTLRKQMAVFVLKSKEGSVYVPPPAVGIFTDVPAADPFAPWIEELYNRGVVAGCGPGPTYCPNSPVLRQQMAVFLLKSLLGSGYTPPAAVGLFGDVPISNPFAPWIEDLFTRAIAAGCGAGNFCLANSTTRAQMAPFLVKTFGLMLYSK